MPITLVFGSDSVLREGERELRLIETDMADPYARVTAAERSYDVLREGRAGWRFSLLDAGDARVVCELHPARLRRGGVLQGETIAMRLQAKLLGAGAWTISIPDRGSLSVTREAGGLESKGEGGRKVVTLGSGIPPALRLTSEDWPLSVRDVLPTLVLACWLIVQWEMLPGQSSSGVFVAGP
jgi:hypothetical protein